MWNKLKNLYKENTIFTIWLGIFLMALSLAVYTYMPEAGKKYWFQDNGHFPWVGISAIGAMISVAVAIKNNKDNFTIELKSKNQIKLVDDVKTILAEYIALQDVIRTGYAKAKARELEYFRAGDLLQAGQIEKTLYDKVNQAYTDAVDDLNDSQTKANILFNKLKLNLTSETKDETFVKQIVEVQSGLSNYRERISELGLDSFPNDAMINSQGIADNEQVKYASNSWANATNGLVDSGKEWIKTTLNQAMSENKKG